MVSNRSIIGALALFAFGMGACGCGPGNDMTQAEIDAGKHRPPLTATQKAQMMDMMAKGGAAQKSQESDWAKNNPGKLAEVNAARAKAGKPPLGQE